MARLARCVFLLVPAIGLCLIPSHAQSPATSSQPASGQQAPPTNVTTLHTGTKLVVVDVVVRDKSGKPIHGLTREDFVLSESGKQQTVNSFEEYAAPAASPAAPRMPALPPGLFTNFTPVPANGPLNILLIDGLNTPLADQSYLRQQLLDYVQHVPAGTRIAIFGLANHLYMLQGFTSDPRQLKAILGGVKGGIASPLLNDSNTDTAALTDALTDPGLAPATGSNGSALMTNDVQTFIEQIGVAQTGLRIGETIEALDSLGHWLVNFPGRKNLIWFSGAFPLGVDFTASMQNNTDIPGVDSDMYREMTNLLTRAQVSVYPVDPRGNQADPAFTPSGTLNPRQGTAYTQASSAFYTNEAAEHSSMDAIASDTGGETFYNRNDLTKAVGDATQDGANYYTLSYSPSEKKTGGEWRSIRIALANPGTYKGVQLSYRRGYFADDIKVPAHHTGTAEVSEDPNAPSVESSRYYRMAMLHGAPTPQDIPFTTRVLPASASLDQALAPGNSPDTKTPISPPFRRYDVDCAAAARYFSLTVGSDGHHTGSIQVAVFVYDVRGKLLNRAARTLTLDLTPEAYARFQRLGFSEHLEISAPAKEEVFLRIGIQERTSGRIGAIEVASSAIDRLPPPDYAAAPGHRASGASDSSSHP